MQAMFLFLTGLFGFITTGASAPVFSDITNLTEIYGTAALFRRADNEAICADKNQALTNAIGKFCQNTNLIVPSTYAETPMWSDPEYDHNPRPWGVNISPSCADSTGDTVAGTPPQFVPQEICYSQFWEMCATGDEYGANNKLFGVDGMDCQFWLIPPIAPGGNGLDWGIAPS